MARLHVPLSTLRRRPYDCLRMTRGQGDWLGLPCTTLSFATPRRFSTAHIAVGTGLTASPPHGIAVNFGRGLGEIRRGTLHLLRASPGRFGAIVVETSSNS